MNTETKTPEMQSDLSRHTDDLRRDAGNVAKDIKDKATEKVQDVKDQASQQLEKAKVSAQDVVNSVRGYVAEHPFAAFGAGVLLGIFLTPRPKSRS